MPKTIINGEAFSIWEYFAFSSLLFSTQLAARYSVYSKPMKPLFTDGRKAITGEFFIMDSRLRHISRKAYKKIKSWKASFKAKEPEDHYHEQFANLLQHSFFDEVSNQYILSKEKYFERPLNN